MIEHSTSKSLTIAVISIYPLQAGLKGFLPQILILLCLPKRLNVIISLVVAHSHCSRIVSSQVHNRRVAILMHFLGDNNSFNVYMTDYCFRDKFETKFQLQRSLRLVSRSR